MKKRSLSHAFAHAFRGLLHFVRSDRNGRIHFFAAMAVTVAGLYFHITTGEWISLLTCFAMVIAFEMCNHAIEQVCDVVHAEHHPSIKIAKDVAAAAVLWSAVISAVIGSIVFVPKILALL